jgi:hypothetical protein
MSTDALIVTGQRIPRIKSKPLSRKQSATLNESIPRCDLALANQSCNSSSKSRRRHDASSDGAGDDNTRLAQSH